MTRHQLVQKLLELHKLREAATRIEQEILAELISETDPDPADRGHDTVPVKMAHEGYVKRWINVS